MDVPPPPAPRLIPARLFHREASTASVLLGICLCHIHAGPVSQRLLARSVRYSNQAVDRIALHGRRKRRGGQVVLEATTSDSDKP